MKKPTPGPWVLRYCSIEGVAFCCGTGPSEEDDANARLIVAAVNSCFAINPDNPLAVAEALPGLTGALKEIMRGEGAFNLEPMRHAENCIENMKDIARAALAKLEAK